MVDWTTKVAIQRPKVMVIDDNRDELIKYAEELFYYDFDPIAVWVPMGMRSNTKPPFDIALHEAWSVRDVLRLARTLKPDAVLSDSELNWDNAKGEDLLELFGEEFPGTARALHSSKVDRHEQRDDYDRFPKIYGLSDVAEYFRGCLAAKGQGRA